MKRYIERVWELITDDKTKNNVVLYDESTPKGISYERLGIVSGKVYAYLKEKGIGKEDFVLINLPRGVLPFMAIIGAWRAGAPIVIIEENFAPERIEFIRKDVDAKEEISIDIWDEIMGYEPLDGYEETDLHDAAYAVYTSGTTGNPKGVLHEFGNLERLVLSAKYEGEEIFDIGERYAHAAPLNFVASLMVICYGIYINRGKMYILSFGTVKNPLALIKFLYTKRITLFFLTPTYARKFAGKTGPFLKKMVVGSEPANNYHTKGVTNFNMYAQSESGVITAMFVIDREYASCPVGKPQFDMKYHVIDDNGNILPNGEIGEFCFENPYVRGYINLPEETKKAFVDGMYHTGDLAYIMPDGNVVICGRKNDMIKINGNRIEPAEIEAAICSAVKADSCAVKGFVSDKHSYICAYYTGNITIDADELRETLKKRLPYYMIPAYFMKLESLPVNANGKLDRKSLPEPEIKDFVEEYVAPTNEIEKKLCEAMQKVLGAERIGINDDFYEMGGDSLASMELLVESDLKGLDSGCIFRGRTPCNIAKLYTEQMKDIDESSDDLRNEEVKKVDHKLTVEQLYMFDYQLYTPKSTMFNLFMMLRMEKDEIDINRLARAVERTINNHPALCTTLHFNNDGEVVQRYSKDNAIKITPEQFTSEEFEIIKNNLVEPFKMVNAPLCRARLFETEEGIYLFFDVHHILFDGTSFKIMFANIVNSYMGLSLENDYYYLMLQKREEEKLTDFYLESKEYFEKKYGGVEWTLRPQVDSVSRENEIGELEAEVKIDSYTLSLMEKKLRVSRSEFFITIALLATAFYSGKDDVLISWIYNGRNDVASNSSVGLFFRDLPVAIRLNDKMNVSDVFYHVHNQAQEGIKHSCYPYIEADAKIIDGDTACVLYQQDIRDLGEFGGFNITSVDIRQNKPASQCVLDIQILDGENGLKYIFDYAASRYEGKSIENFLNLCNNMIKEISEKYDSENINVGQLKKAVMPKKAVLENIKKLFGK